VSTPLDSKKAKSFTSADLAERTLYRRAVEAVIWGMPAVNLRHPRDAEVFARDG
jgi:hypothetical protein